MASVDETTQKVQRILASKFNNVMLADNGFAVERGSTRVKIEVKDFGKDAEGNPQSIVYLWAPIGREIPTTPEFFRWAATEAQGYRFGATAVYESEDKKTCLAVFAHSLLADFLDPDELENAIWMVAGTADDLDDKVHDQFGGKRYTDE
jgi:hypothetical protein